ncbi:hypothetical protein DFH29DRAFT_1000528 [Suillus ampliporus]|nr:hypothetical protein DFH29DRAFT_1000528 [Suillus ampliporus]
MDSLQWHLQTFRSSSFEISDDDSDWDLDSASSKDSYQTDSDFRSHRHSGSIDSTESSGPSQTPLDAFLDSELPPEDRWTGPAHLLIGLLNPYNSDTTPESPESESEFDDEDLLILNTPEALYQLFLKDKLQVQINSMQRWELLCPECEEWCQTGIHCGIPLWIPGQFRSFSNHRGSKKCEAAAKKKKKTGGNTPDAPIPRSLASDVHRRSSCVATHPSTTQTCPGVPVLWPEDLRPFAMLFPWERYHNGPDSIPFTIDITDFSLPRARSKLCSRSAATPDLPCDECTDVSVHIARLVELARDPKPRTNYKFLRLAHMQDTARSYAEQVNALKLQGLTDSRKYMRALTQLDDYHRLLMAISENNIPRLQQIINVALCDGASIREIINKLEDTLEGVYRLRGYSVDDLDIATLVYRLGGRQLLYTLNKTGLPSLRTLQTHSIFTLITPTIGPIIDQNFDDNIRSLILNTRVGVTSSRGVSLMVDEMAIHYPRYNKIGGLCWKHSSLVDPVLRTYDSAVRIAQKIHDGEVHLGKEVTVIGAVCFGEEELYLILVAPTCKTEDSKDTEIVLAHTIQRWSATGADRIVGPVWSFATDGDATRRAAGHRLFLKNPLSMHSPLYGILSNMPGLNTFTGFCTLICSPAGIILNNGHLINAVMLARYLVWLPAYDETSVTKLLHPDDPQDVPRAVELMQAIIDLSKSQHVILNDSFSSDIDTCADLVSIMLLSSVVESILIPFTNVDLSLTEQVQYLSRYAHLSFALFRSHRRSFMGYQLYYNSHTMYKNIIFCIVKQQLLDPSASFFLSDSGDDHLELHFGCTRMIGGHNSGCTFSQVIDRLGATKDVDGVFKRHPDMDPGHHRLRLGTRQEDVDHINRDMWKGDIISGRCDLPSAWATGHEMAFSILSMSQIDPINFSFLDLFRDPGVDMLRPFGENKYFGISNSADEDLVPVVPAAPAHSAIAPFPFTHTDTGTIHEVHPEEEEELMLTFEEALTSETASDTPSDHPTPFIDPSAPPLPEGPGICPADYLLFKGRWIHKQTICRLVINKDFASKSHNQLERVRAGYTKVNRQIDMSSGRITDFNSFLIGDIFVTLLRSNQTLSIAILRSTSILLNNVSRALINATIMKSTRTTAKVTGQLLTILPTHPSPESLQLSFLWNGGYVKARSAIQGTTDSTERVVSISVIGSMIEPINPEPTFIRLRDDINTDDFSEIKGGQSTWQVSADTLQAACDLLWAKAVEMKFPLNSISSVSPSDPKNIPYRLPDGTPAVISIEASALLAASEGARITVCPLCETSVSDMRCHIGMHILRALTNTPEKTSLKEPVGTVLPCGFCGRSGMPQCAITIMVKGDLAPTWETKCIYKHTFRYGSAVVGSKNTPSRNVPMKLSIDAVWRYNMAEHILTEHEEYVVPGHRETGVALPSGVLAAMVFSELEQKAAHIPKERWPTLYDHTEKENTLVSMSRPSKRPALNSTSSMPAKRARMAVQPLHTTRTMIV